MSVSKYCGRLFPVAAGQVISIVGKVCNNPDRFDIDLRSGNESADILLHVSARFQGEPVVVRNTKVGGKWGQEERAENLFPHNNLNPIKLGGDFKIDIFVDQYAYFISIDDKPFCTYGHRIPLEDIQMICISSDVEAIYQVNQKNSQVRPWPAVNVNAFEAFTPGEFNPGNVIVITGVPKGNIRGDFSVDLYDGSNRFRRHFQFRSFIDNSTAILDSQDDNGNWRGEIPTNHPFKIGEVFKLAIALTNNEFQVAANGQMIAALPYTDHNERLFGSLTGVSIISNNGLNVQVQGVSYMKIGDDCCGCEQFCRI